MKSRETGFKVYSLYMPYFVLEKLGFLYSCGLFKFKYYLI